jgi:DNA-binding GntR family transcriptional regulator
MTGYQLDKNGYHPYYIQIRHILLDRINNGIYGYGELLPSESKLAEEFSVTRVTVRKALSLLKQEQVITSSRGIGWRVTHHRIEQKLTSSYWFGLEVGDTGSSAQSQILEVDLITLPQNFDKFFEFISTDLLVYKIIRLRLYESSPISLEYSFIPAHRTPNIDRKIEKNESLKQLLEETYAIRIGHSVEYLSPQLSSMYASEHLGIPTGSPVFETTRVTYDTANSVIEIRQSIIRGDKVVFRKDFP